MLRADHISKAFQGKAVLRDYDQVFETGCHYALMGPSGCGKTTLLRLLMGLLTPDSGTIRYDGLVQMSAAFQEDRLFEHLNAVQNLLLLPGATQEKAYAMLKAMELDDASLAQPVSQLSGGMKRRVALARALMAPHSILFLDEPYKGLDDETRSIVRKITEEQEKGKTVIMVTHDEKDTEGWILLHLGAARS